MGITAASAAVIQQEGLRITDFSQIKVRRSTSFTIRDRKE
jgi:hypothetical protein